jgi:isopentenyldiphosphate isomerase
MAYPPVVIVDKDDNPTGLAMLKDAKAQGLYYRVVAVTVLDGRGRILLQKRSLNMEIDPGTWDISAGGHVDEGKTYQSAAVAELKEELGIVGVEPLEFGKEFLGDCFLMLYTAAVPDGAKLEPGADEVSDVKWFTPEEFESLLSDNPEQCAEFLKEIHSRAPSMFSLDLAAA